MRRSMVVKVYWASILMMLSFKLTAIVEAWPGGIYGIPMGELGCPPSDDFTWATGTRTQMTKPGSFASEKNHLAVIFGEGGKTVEQQFCMKMTPKPGGDGHYKWMKGSYCIYKKGSCPVGFQLGYVRWDDAAPLVGSGLQEKTGTLPDGVYDSNTHIEYCCRKDGSPQNAIQLPKEHAFFLFKVTKDCQEIQGMKHHTEFIEWQEETFLINMGSRGAIYPYMRRTSHPKPYLRMFYCYYEPVPDISQKVMVAAIVIGSVLGFLLLMGIIWCVVRRYHVYKEEKREYVIDDNTANAELEMEDVPTVTTTAPSGAAANGRSPIYTGKAPIYNPPEKQRLDNEKEPMLPPDGAVAGRSGTGPSAGAGEEEVPMLKGVMPPPPEPHEEPPSYEDVLKENAESSKA